MDQPATSEATSDSDSTEEVHAARATLYGALGGVFIYPDSFRVSQEDKQLRSRLSYLEEEVSAIANGSATVSHS
jgi:hypothetical protein